jgi:pilus assembly protein CpaF
MLFPQGEQAERWSTELLGRFTRAKTTEPQQPPTSSTRPHAATEPEKFHKVAKVVKEESEEEKARHRYIALKVDLHQYLLNEINLSMLDQFSREELTQQIRDIVKGFIREKSFPLNARELDQLLTEVSDEMLGLGPLEPLLQDDAVSDILINTHETVFVEKGGRLQLSSVRFRDEEHLLRVINKIVTAVGRRVDESYPMADARLLDGSRVNVAIRPIAVDGPLVSIRKFSKRPFSFDKLVEFNSIRTAMVDVLAAAVRGRKSLIISGGTGSGKTTLLNALSNFIPEYERLLTIEDAAELQLQQPHVGRMETRPPNTEGKGEIRQRELVKNALRMRPDRIILGEVRGEEAFDMLQAMNTGHEGSMATIHANSPREAISRLEQMIGMAGLPMSQNSIRGQIASAVQIIVQVQRLSDGGRRVTSVSEITGIEGDIVQMQEIFRFVKEDIAEDGKIIGNFYATGIRPRFLEDVRALGILVPQEIFDPTHPLPMPSRV